ncbi:MAG: carbon-nitrogen hydrolase family protein [Gammaproteobacteria bacterium]
MSDKFRIALVQNSAIDNLDSNISECEAFVRRAVDRGADLICLPEYFACLERKDSDYLSNGFAEADHPALKHFMALASDTGRWILLGSLPIKISPQKVHNRSYLIDPNGAIAATYNKIHLFNVALKKGELYEESRTVEPGESATIVEIPWGKLGLTICYDVRFPQLYRHLAKLGADFISVPAAFTATTGEAHWHVLLRARAIETGSYIFAPGQCGRRPWGRKTYGHSLIVAPWGEILADGGENPGIVVAEVDRTAVDEARRMIPSLSHDRAFL